jgi:hypothetical protein
MARWGTLSRTWRTINTRLVSRVLPSWRRRSRFMTCTLVDVVTRCAACNDLLTFQFRLSFYRYFLALQYLVIMPLALLKSTQSFKRVIPHIGKLAQRCQNFIDECSELKKKSRVLLQNSSRLPFWESFWDTLYVGHCSPWCLLLGPQAVMTALITANMNPVSCMHINRVKGEGCVWRSPECIPAFLPASHDVRASSGAESRT